MTETNSYVLPEGRRAGPPVSPAQTAAPFWPVICVVVLWAVPALKAPLCSLRGAHSVFVRP